MHVFVQIRQFVHFEFIVLIVRLWTREESSTHVVNLVGIDVVGRNIFNRFSHMDIYGIC